MWTRGHTQITPTEQRMRILLISNEFPDNPEQHVSGTFQRLRMFADALKRHGTLDCLFYVQRILPTDPTSVTRYQRSLSDHWETELDLTLCPRASSPDKWSRWDEYGSGMFSFFRQRDYRWTSSSTHVRSLEAALDRNPDLIFVHRLSAMCPLMLTRRPLAPVIFDLDDIAHVTAKRNIGQPPLWLTKRLRYLQLPALWLGERRAISLATRTFVCSEQDRRYLQRTMRLPGIEVVPNAVRFTGPLPPVSAPTLLFLGSLGYLPNANAAKFLIEKTWPRIRQAVPTARLVIAGSHSERVELADAQPDGVEFTGFVRDLDELYRRVRVVCVPILSGGGTRVKIIEAAALGKPIVSTRMGAEGLEFEDGRDIILRDSPKEFAESCIQLLTDDDACRRIGGAAHDRAVERYDRSVVVDQIERQIFESSIEQQPSVLGAG